MIVQGGFIRAIIPRLGERRSLIVGLMISATSFALYGLASRGWMMYAIPFFGAFGAIAQPSAQSIITQQVKANEQGAIQGALASLNSLTGVVGPLIATNVFSYFISQRAPFHLPGAAFFLGSILIVVGIGVALNTFRRMPAQQANVSQAAAPPMH
jgi:DHA1 family tetracycline resistance protein-like MFS transporter